MADNTTMDPGSGGDKIALDELTYSGDTAKVQLARLVHVTGSEGAKTLHEYLFAEDDAHTTGDYGIQGLTVRKDAAAALGGTDGDYQPIITDANGRVHVLDQNSAAILADTASMDTNLGTVAGAVSGSEMQVDVVAALPAGTNAIGKLAANSGVDIGDVDVLSLPASTNTIEVVGDAAENAAAAGNPLLTGGRYDATPRTLGDGDVGAIALDADGAVQVSDGGNALTVDGAVTETNSTAILADTASMDTNLGTVAGAVSGTEMQVDVVTSALPTGAATAANQSTANTSLSNIDTDASTIAGDTTSLDGKVPTIPTGAGTEAAAVRVTVATDSTGVLSVDDGGGSLTVDGAVTETNSTAILADTASIDTNCGTIAGDTTSIDSKITACNTGAVVVSSGAITETNSTAILADTASMDTNLGTVAGAVSGSEMQVDVVAALPAGTNAIGKLAANSGVDIGDVDVTSIAAGANLVGDVGLSGARTSGGTTPYRNIDVDESEDQVKGTGGQVYWLHAMNLASAVRYLHVYNATAASVTVGTTTPTLTFPIATQGDTNGAGFTLSIPNGIAFGTAITVAATTTIGGADAPGANEVILNMGYA